MKDEYLVRTLRENKRTSRPDANSASTSDARTKATPRPAANGRWKEEVCVAVARSLSGVAIVQADRFKPDRPRLALIVQERHLQQVTRYTRKPTTEQRGAAHRNQLLVAELDRYQPRPRARAEPHCHIDPVTAEIRQGQRSPDIHLYVRMLLIEIRKARQQPVRSQTRRRTDRQDAIRIIWPDRLDAFGDFADGGLHAFQEPASLVGQQHASAAAPEKSRSQMLFQTLDALAHRAVGDVHLLGGVREIQVSGSRFEEAKRLERRKYARHAEMIAPLTADAKNHRWQSSHQHSIIRSRARPQSA